MRREFHLPLTEQMRALGGSRDPLDISSRPGSPTARGSPIQSRSFRYVTRHDSFDDSLNLPRGFRRRGSFIIEDRDGARTVYTPSAVLGSGGYGEVREFDYSHWQDESGRWQTGFQSNTSPLAVKRPIGNPENFNRSLENEEGWNRSRAGSPTFATHRPSKDMRDGQTRIIMDLIPGCTLQTLLSRGDMPTLRKLNLFLAIAACLNQHHQAGYVHADFKSDNVMVGRISENAEYAPQDITIIDGSLSGPIGDVRAAFQPDARLRHYPPEMFVRRISDRYVMQPSIDVFSFCYQFLKYFTTTEISNFLKNELDAGKHVDPQRRTTLPQLIEALQAEILHQKLKRALVYARITGDSTAALGTSRRCVYQLRQAIQEFSQGIFMPARQWTGNVKEMLSVYLNTKLSEKHKESKLVEALIICKIIDPGEHGISEATVGCCCSSVGYARRIEASLIVPMIQGQYLAGEQI